MTFSFEGKKVLVTGGAGGLGSAICRKFVESGATVYALDCDEVLLKKLKLDLPTVQTVVGDLSKWDEIRNVVTKLGPLDHLVNNAGVGSYETVLEITESGFDRVMNINLKAALNLSQLFAKTAIANSIKGATIVNISSVRSIGYAEAHAAYSCSKAAMDMMTKAFAFELGPHGIRVNSILPTGMPTTMCLDQPPRLKAQVDAMIARVPIQGLLETADAANLVLYLSSPLSTMITGTNIPIDGGLLTAL